jgi:RNA polymerase sigma-70 factor (ECF subfamily)
MLGKRIPDEELLRATEGNPSAFDRFYRRHESAVLLYFLRRTSAVDVAADLTAETFAAALEGAAGFRGESSAIGWLFGIARNVLRSSYRDSRVQDEVRRRIGMMGVELTDLQAEQLERMQRQAIGAEALRLVEHLPEQDREAIRAYILEDRSYEEISTELECSTVAVRKRVSRGLQALRLQMPKRSSEVGE